MFKKNMFILVGLLIVFVSSAFCADNRLDSFDKYIKPDSAIKSSHPFLLYSSQDIAILRQKSKTPYFKDFVSDLMRFADVTLIKYKDYVFPFKENPNYNTASEALIMAYLLSGDKKYAKSAISTTLRFVKAHYLKVPLVTSGKFTGHLRDGNSVSFVLNTIAIVYDALYSEMTPDERFKIRRAIAYFCKLTYDMAVTEEYGFGFYKNYRAGQMGALGLACLSIKNEVDLETQEWLDKAIRMSVAWGNVAVKADGMYPEGVTYLYYMLRNQLLFFEALNRNTGLNLFKRTNYKKAVVWTIWSSMPWTYEFDNYGDGRTTVYMQDMPFVLQKNYPEYGDFLVRKVYGTHLRYRANAWSLLYGHKPQALAHNISTPTEKKCFFARLFGKKTAKKVKQSGFNPKAKLGLSKVFPLGGMAAFRTGWSNDDMLLLTYAADYEYDAHCQADKGHFNLYAYGKTWAADSGYGNDAKQFNTATSSKSHSVVLIDDKGQAYDHTMRQSGTFGEIIDYYANNNFGYVKVDQSDAYNWYVRYRYYNKRVWTPVKHAYRNILFINKGQTPPYVLVYDDIQKDDQAHQYDWQFQTAPGNIVQTENNAINIRPVQFAGKSLYCAGAGAWDNFKSPGFNVYRKQAGEITFKVNVPKAGKYYMWALARAKAFTNAEVDVYVNSKLYPRCALGKTKDFAWKKYDNKQHHAKREVFQLDFKEGENTVFFRGVFSGYEIAKCIITDDPNFVPTTAVAKSKAVIASFGAEQVVKLKDVVVKDVDTKTDATCDVKMLYPNDCKITQDLCLPSKELSHPRVKFSIKTVKPDFLAMVYPHLSSMEIPKTSTEKIEGDIKTIISWENCDDNITVSKDGNILFERFNKSGKLLLQLDTLSREIIK